ncbi:MAG TPA: hypothetical protein DIC19_06080 [Erysipelotrichaceae bacterium]|nr:hypothetical protein [Erysipelotrichaceae bacterium]
MKNLLNRLTRFMIIMLMLVDRTPFFNVYAENNGNNDGGEAQVTVLTPTSLAVDVAKPDVGATVTKNTYWQISKTVDKPVLNLPIAGSDTVNYTVSVLQTSDITFNLTYEVTYTLTGTTPADFSVRASVKHPSGNDLYSVAEIDSFVDVSNSTFKETYTTQFTVNEATLALISPFKINIEIFAESDLATIGVTNQTPAINVKSPNVTNVDGTLTLIDAMDPSSPRIITAPGSYSYPNVISSTSLDPRTVTNTVNGSTPGGSTYTSSASVLVNTYNQLPSGGDQNLTTAEETALPIVLFGSDPDSSQTLTYHILTSPAGGTLSDNALSSNITYTPNLNYYGTTSFTYRVFDGINYSAPGTINIEVTNVNDAPVATGDTINVDEGATVTESFIISDVDDTVLTVHFVDLPDFGLVADNGDGTYTYSHNGNDPIQNDYFTYYVQDPSGATSATVRVNILVAEINEAPVGVNDTASTDEDVSIDIPFATLLANDTDVDTAKALLTITSVGSAVNGSVSIVGSVVQFVPTPNYNGPASFEYTVSDGLLTDTAIVSVTVNPVNDAPAAVNDAYGTNEDTPLNVPVKGVLTNDTDIELNNLTAILVSGPSNGSLTLNADGSFTYTPNANFNGSDSFTYKANDGSADSNIATVTITVNAVNDAPVADNDAYSTNEDTALNVAAPGVLEGDTDPEGNALSSILVSGPAHGSLALNADGSFTYTPTANYHGSDSFTYKANDASADSNVATVTLTVNPVNDAPDANDDSYSTDEDVTLIVAAPGVLFNDVDVDGTMTVSVVVGSEPTEGTLTQNPNGSFTYVPAPNKFGTYTFTYRASDGTLSDTAVVTITVRSSEDNPVATPSSFSVNEGQQHTGSVTGVDGDGDVLTYEVVTGPAHGTLDLISTGAFTYTHDGTETPNVDKFTFKVSDDGGLTFSAPADVNITILDINDAPVAVNDTYSTSEDTELVVPVLTGVLANDSDSDSSITAVKLTDPAKGTVTLAADGSFTYTPNANANGSDSFTYQAFDGTAYSNIAIVNINITAVNDKPVANPQTLSTAEDTALPIVLTGSDVETALVDLVYTVVNAPTHGSLSGTGSSITYTPSSNYNGSDSFTFTVSDGSLTSDPATVAITVNPINDTPVAVLDSYSTNEDTLLTVPTPGIKGNDIDVDNDPLTVSVVTNVVNGSLNLNNDGSFTYLPSVNFNGSDSFTYKLNDGTVDSNTVTVTITINAINDRPVANDQSLTTPEDTSLNITLTGTDTEGSSLLYGVALAPSHGTLSGTAPNLVYTPAANYTGSDSFIFGISDGFFRDYATITINVTPVNDRPVAQNGEVTTAEDTAILINFVASDVETASLIYGISVQPSNGVLSGSGASRTYTPNANFTGTDTFVFGVSDGFFRAYGTITVNVTPVNDAPVALSNLYATDEDTALVVAAPGVLGNDTDVDGNTLTADLVDVPNSGTVIFNADGSFTYTPTADFSGLDSFTYKANDGLLDSNVATVTINVNSVEDAPVAVDDPEDEEIDVIETPEDTPLVLDFEDLLANDYDVDDLTFGQMTLMLTPLRSFDFNTAFSPSVGSLTLDMTGRTVTFNPPLNYVGPAQFEYTIIDEDDNVSAPATVFIEVTPVNDAPVASPLAFTIANAGSSTGQLVASDVDEGEVLVYSLLAAPTNGTATVSPTGAYTYTHNGTAILSDSFTFSVTDGELSATATVTVTVLAAPTPPPVNLPPVANALAFTIANGAVSTGTLTGSDPEGAPISFAIASLPANGSLTISPAGIYVYDHNGTATTADSFTFTVSDGSLTSTATVSITILPIPAPGNTPPEVIDGVDSTPFGEVLEGNVAILGSDADGDDLTFALVDGPANGTLVFNPDGTYTYTPNEGFEGSDSFTFIANDGTDDSNTGTLTINVLEEEVIVEEPETPLAAPDNNWLWWLLALLAGLLLWLLAFLRPNMKYTLSDKANNQKIVRRRLAKPDDKTMIVELNDKDMVGLATIEVEFFKRLAKHCGDVTVKFMLKGTQVHSVTIPADIDDAYTTIIHL